MEGTTTLITSADFSAVLDSITSQINVGSIVEVLGVALAAAVPLVFMWWGVRQLKGKLMGAFRKGRM